MAGSANITADPLKQTAAPHAKIMEELSFDCPSERLVAAISIVQAACLVDPEDAKGTFGIELFRTAGLEHAAKLLVSILGFVETAEKTAAQD